MNHIDETVDRLLVEAIINEAGYVADVAAALPQDAANTLMQYGGQLKKGMLSAAQMVKLIASNNALVDAIKSLWQRLGKEWRDLKHTALSLGKRTLQEFLINLYDALQAMEQRGTGTFSREVPEPA